MNRNKKVADPSDSPAANSTIAMKIIKSNRRDVRKRKKRDREISQSSERASQ